MKKGSFYYFFESKSELAIAALEDMWTQDWKPALDAQFSPSIDPLHRITEYLARAYEKQAKTKADTGKVLGCPLFSVGSEMSTQDEKLSAKVREIFARKRRYYESAIREAAARGDIEPCDAAQKAQALYGLIEGNICQARIMNDPEVVRALPQMALDILRPTKPVPLPA